MEDTKNLKSIKDYQEISLLDIVLFTKYAYKTLLVFGILGLTVAIAYLVFTPKKYEATAIIGLTKIIVNSNSNSNSNNNLWVNLEQPAALISRLSLPTSFSEDVVRACSFNNKYDLEDSLGKVIKLKVIADDLELRAVGASPEEASLCAKAFFGLIKTTQAQIKASYIEEYKFKLGEYEALFQKVSLPNSKPGSGSTTNFGYLNSRVEANYFLDKIVSLKSLIRDSENQSCRLLAPIYVNKEPIFPKKIITLVAGLFGGLFLGFLVALGRQLILKPKGEVADVA